MGVSRRRLAFYRRSPDPVIIRTNSHVAEARAAQVRLDLLWRGVLRHVGRTVRGRKRTMDFEHFPASIGAKIYVIDINSAVGP
ncbi:MAG: hypothetical protein DMF02_02305 [Verrucomicrobia bacterium]|nr:MAG: hypothetical protein DMF02_02305 [Verrucomicrobiota bacterium]